MFDPSYYVRHPNEFQYEPEDFATFKSEITGKTYASREHMIDDEVKFQMANRQPTPEELAFEKLTPEQIRALAERESQSNADLEGAARTAESLRLWLAYKPEYRDTVPNSRQMTHYFRERGIKHPTAAQLDQAFEELYAAGLLDVDHAKIEARKNREARERAELIRRAGGLNRGKTQSEYEAECESLSLDQIRQKAQGHSGGVWDGSMRDRQF